MLKIGIIELVTVDALPWIAVWAFMLVIPALISDRLWASMQGFLQRIGQASDRMRTNPKSAIVRNANLEGANLKGVDLRGINYKGANLRGANLEGANLEDANLEGANLLGANLQGANLTGSTYDSKTIWPDGFDAFAAGAILVVYPQ